MQNLQTVTKFAARSARILACLCACSLGLSAEAGAALPGRNSVIAFAAADVAWQGSEEEAYTIFPVETGAVDLDGRHRRFVTRGGDPAFSPRGRLLAFAYGGVRIRPLSGGEVTRLTRGADRFPTWSPSGRRLAFARERPGPHGYCEWTGSREVAYDSGEPCPASIYTIRRDGGDLRMLVHTGWNPSWSSRGEIAYEGADAAIWASDSQGAHVRRVVVSGADPDWSPRGGRIAFVRQRNSNSALFVVNRDGSGLRRLFVTGRHSLHSPVWSPDGRRIAFVKDEGLPGAGLYTMSLADGSRPSKLMGIWCHICGGEVTTLYGLAWRPL